MEQMLFAKDVEAPVFNWICLIIHESRSQGELVVLREQLEKLWFINQWQKTLIFLGSSCAY